MKKTVLSLIAIAALCGCFQRSTLSDGRLVVGFDADFPPYGYKEGTEYKGFDLDLARAVCEKKGWTFVACPINWDAKDMELNSGSIDCIWNGFTILDREDDYTWSSPYVGNRQVVLVKKGSPIRDLAGLKDKIVGVQTDTPVYKALSGKTKKPMPKVAALGKTFKNIVVMPNYNQAINELKMGGVDAVALDIGVAQKKMKDIPNTFEILKEVIMTEAYGIGFKKGNTALRDIIDEVMIELGDDGTLKIIAGKYGIDEDSLLTYKQ